MQIKELKIYSSNLNEQKDFYAHVLGLNLIEYKKDFVAFKIGESILKITYRPASTPYHFAINIPANKEAEALDWLKSRVEILKDGTNEIIDFKAWNAKAIYFYDKDKNIVELIARKNLETATEQKFDGTHLLEISEIGLPTIDIKKVYSQLHKLTGIAIFDGTFDRFCAIGDEHGLFICINKTLKNWFPTNDKAFESDFQVGIIEKGTAFLVDYKNGILTINKS